MNLDEYIIKSEEGAFSIEEIEKIANNPSISKIFRLYASYGEAQKPELYNHDSLQWILSYLERELKEAGFEKAASLLNIDVNNSFSCFWNQFQQLNQDNAIETIKS